MGTTARTLGPASPSSFSIRRGHTRAAKRRPSTRTCAKPPDIARLFCAVEGHVARRLTRGWGPGASEGHQIARIGLRVMDRAQFPSDCLAVAPFARGPAGMGSQVAFALRPRPAAG
jgi:hypothetical protein